MVGIYKSLTDTCRNKEQCRTVSILGIFLSNFWYSAFAVLSLSLSMINAHELIEKLFIYICFTYSYMEESLGQSKVMRLRGVEGGRWYRGIWCMKRKTDRKEG
jgi:hypothetical protein